MIAIQFSNVTAVSDGQHQAQFVTIRHGRVQAVDEAVEDHALQINGAGGFLLPGLINAHDHLGLNHYPRTRFRDRYNHAVDWFADMEAERERDPALIAAGQVARRRRLWFGGLKNILAGTTTVAHHNPLSWPLRHWLWRLWPGADRAFPVHVVQRYGFAHSLYRGADPAASYQQTPARFPWLIHLAEGTDARAAAELPRLRALGALGSNTVLIHGVGLTAAQQAELIDAGGGLVWCPASNDFLLGATADVTRLAAAGRLALGSDARLTGSADLLAELKAAAATGQLTPADLLATVTTNAAALLRLPGAGALRPGAPADLMLLPPLAATPAEALLAADRADLRLILRQGQPVLGDPDMAPVFAAARVKARAVNLDGRPKLMAAWLVRGWQRLALVEPGLHLAS